MEGRGQSPGNAPKQQGGSARGGGLFPPPPHAPVAFPQNEPPLREARREPRSPPGLGWAGLGWAGLSCEAGRALCAFPFLVNQAGFCLDGSGAGWEANWCVCTGVCVMTKSDRVKSLEKSPLGDSAGPGNPVWSRSRAAVRLSPFPDLCGSRKRRKQPCLKPLGSHPAPESTGFLNPPQANQLPGVAGSLSPPPPPNLTLV